MQQREGLIERLEKRGLAPLRAIVFGCVRHHKELELKAAFEAGWPGGSRRRTFCTRCEI
ncbi:hypothetical protein OAO87_03740 [bacterium]|nr:hypothetical protein [bacterium]